jgi:putative salt-induced outer membrane protein YdiY
LRTKTADDRFAVGSTDDFAVVEDTTRDLDAERYYVFSRYDRRINDRLFWVAGGGWERDLDAGIENRTSLFGGLGNIWLDRDNVRFRTDYALTFTAREDEIPDPERDDRYSEARFSLDFMQKFGKNAQFDSDFVFNVNVGQASDNRFNTINAVTSNLTGRLALRASLQLIYHNLPALEELDLLDRDGGVEIGTVVVRKKKLDTVVKISLVITI